MAGTLTGIVTFMAVALTGIVVYTSYCVIGQKQKCHSFVYLCSHFHTFQKQYMVVFGSHWGSRKLRKWDWRSQWRMFFEEREWSFCVQYCWGGTHGCHQWYTETWFIHFNCCIKFHHVNRENSLLYLLPFRWTFAVNVLEHVTDLSTCGRVSLWNLSRGGITRSLTSIISTWQNSTRLLGKIVVPVSVPTFRVRETPIALHIHCLLLEILKFLPI